MWYKVKKIYIYQNWQEKQVRPKVFEFSYSFWGKTVSKIKEDGWDSWYNTENMATNNNWLYYWVSQTTTWVLAINCKTPIDLSKAKLVILQSTWFAAITNSVGVIFWLWNVSSNWVSSLYQYIWYGQHYLRQSYNMIYNRNYTTTAEITLTNTIDLVNKTFTFFSSAWNYEYTWTITDRIVSIIRTQKSINVSIDKSQQWVSSNLILKNIYLKIEY